MPQSVQFLYMGTVIQAERLSLLLYDDWWREKSASHARDRYQRAKHPGISRQDQIGCVCPHETRSRRHAGNTRILTRFRAGERGLSLHNARGAHVASVARVPFQLWEIYSTHTRVSSNTDQTSILVAYSVGVSCERALSSASSPAIPRGP